MRSDVSATIRKCLQDQPIKAPLLSQKAWRVKRNQLKLRMQICQKVGSQDLNRKFQDCLDKLKPVGWKDSMPLTKQSKGVVHWIEEGTLHLLLIEVIVLKCEFFRKAEKAMEKRMLVARDRLVDMFIHARSNLPLRRQWPLP